MDRETGEMSYTKDALVTLSATAFGMLSKLAPSGLIKNYGWDITCPILVYFGTKSFTENLFGDKAPWVYPSLALAIPSLGEIAQRIGLYGGTYDPKDFIAYAIGAGAAFLIDNAEKRKKGIEKKVLNLGMEENRK